MNRLEKFQKEYNKWKNQKPFGSSDTEVILKKSGLYVSVDVETGFFSINTEYQYINVDMEDVKKLYMFLKNLLEENEEI